VLEQARALQATLDKLYWDDKAGGYFTTSTSHEQLLTRDKPSYDGASRPATRLPSSICFGSRS